MYKHTCSPFIIASLFTAFLASGCDDVAEGGDGDEEVEERLYVASQTIWQTLQIPVCWEATPAATAIQRGWVQTQVESVWETPSYVDFTGWGLCPAASPGVRIQVITGNPNAAGPGRMLDGVIGGVQLNFTFGSWSTPCQQTPEACIRNQAAHEFGHVLGFAHEHKRPDKPATCTKVDPGYFGDVTIGPWDLNSIMNYCNPLINNNGQLSATDVVGLRQFYGSPSFALLKRDVVDIGNGYVYFFNGSEYTRYNRAQDRVDSGFPQPISLQWTNWPASFTHVDAAVRIGGKAFFFMGDKFIEHDIAADTIVGPIKPIVGNWGGWPATWTSIDATLDYGNGKVFFFRGSQVLRYDVANNVVDQAPASISSTWPGVFTSGIEYALNYGNGKVYFFKGKDYQRWDIADNAVEAGYPVKIVGRWPGVPF